MEILSQTMSCLLVLGSYFWRILLPLNLLIFHLILSMNTLFSSPSRPRSATWLLSALWVNRLQVIDPLWHRWISSQLGVWLLRYSWMELRFLTYLRSRTTERVSLIPKNSYNRRWNIWNVVRIWSLCSYRWYTLIHSREVRFQKYLRNSMLSSSQQLLVGLRSNSTQPSCSLSLL